ncbi:MAG: thymidylate synthase [Synechococcus sp. CPC35]|nr:thymidylate synthase [Synechococcus sp. CPC35]
MQAEASESLDSQLLEREVMLDRRREAETLLMAFTRAQMTRHYWGEFAASLQELGLPVGHQLETTVESSGAGTRLWIVPRNGTEAYLAEVERWNGRLRTRQCRGERVAVEGDFRGSCPPGWSEMNPET